MTLRRGLGFWARKVDQEPVFTLVGSVLTGGEKYVAAKIDSSGRYIYFLPYDATRVLKYDTQTNTSSFIGSTYSGSDKWLGMCRAANGCFYGAPNTQSQVLKIDPSTDTTSLIGSTISGISRYATATLAQNGMIYCLPLNNTQVLKIDPSTDSTSLIGSSLGSATVKYVGAFLGSDGFIYGVPAANNQPIVKIDPLTDTVTTITFTTGLSFSYSGGGMSYDGNAYFIPWSATRVNRFNLSGPLNTLVGPTISGTFKYNGYVLCPNQKFLFVNRFANQAAFFNSLDSTVTPTGPVDTLTNMYHCGCLAADGSAYFAPFNKSQIMKVSNIGSITNEMWQMPSDLSTLSGSAYNFHQNIT
jgi:hypothetical protein